MGVGMVMLNKRLENATGLGEIFFLIIILTVFLLDSEKKLSLLSEEQEATSTLVETIRQSIQHNDVLKPINLLSQLIKPDMKRQR